MENKVLEDKQGDKLEYIDLFDHQWQRQGSFYESSSEEEEEEEGGGGGRPSKPLEELSVKDLFAILGDAGVDLLVRDFYGRIWAKNDWFQQSFEELADYEHHVWAQSMFWLECFGKGPMYHGGHTRLKYHHSRARNVMNERGAARWMQEMNLALKSALPKVIKNDAELLKHVERVIREFISITMKRYGHDFQFEISDVLETHNNVGGT